ncbi:MAG: hypothetical protein ABL984_18250, partial [Pyrinomonadaceae bacterium]
MTNTKGVQNARRSQWAAGLSLLAILVHGAKAQAPDDAEASFAKCWAISTSVLSEQGVSADDSQSYFVSRDGKVVAIELTSGSVAWTADVGGKPLSE